MKKLLTLLILLNISLTAFAYDIDGKKNAIEHTELGMFYFKKDWYEAAINEFSLALLLNPTSAMSATIQNNLGQVYYEIQDYDFAMESFIKAINLNPNFMQYYKNLIKTYAKKDVKMAINTYRKIVLKDGQNYKAWMILGLLYDEKGNKLLRNKCFQKAINIQPDHILSDAVRQIMVD